MDNIGANNRGLTISEVSALKTAVNTNKCLTINTNRGRSQITLSSWGGLKIMTGEVWLQMTSLSGADFLKFLPVLVLYFDNIELQFRNFHKHAIKFKEL